MRTFGKIAAVKSAQNATHEGANVTSRAIAQDKGEVMRQVMADKSRAPQIKRSGSYISVRVDEVPGISAHREQKRRQSHFGAREKSREFPSTLSQMLDTSSYG